MTDYRRNHVPGGTYFFAVNVHDRRLNLQTEHIEPLLAAVRKTRARYPFHIDAWVVLPDHMHCLWTLPERDTNYVMRWQIIKAGFSRAIEPGEPRTAKAERGIWQRRFGEHTIRGPKDQTNLRKPRHVAIFWRGALLRHWPRRNSKRRVGRALAKPINFV